MYIYIYTAYNHLYDIWLCLRIAAELTNQQLPFVEKMINHEDEYFGIAGMNVPPSMTPFCIYKVRQTYDS